MSLEQTWRWYGPSDTISLQDIKQAGATGVVTALHHLANGEVWPVEEILERKALIEAVGLTWSVVESVPVHEDIKIRKGNYEKYIQNYQQSIRNLGKCGISTICYNFMPVIDWSRTDLEYSFEDGSVALKFDIEVFAAFELFILNRKGATADYSDSLQKRAKKKYDEMSVKDRDQLVKTIIAGLPGAEESYSLQQFKEVLSQYENIDAAMLKDNLKAFLREIIPVAESAGVKMAIHPDDPPMPLLGLPRVVSNLKDALEVIEEVDSVANGITLCTGSFGAGYQNDLAEMTEVLAYRINFVHLRNVKRSIEGSFMEDYLLEGDVNIPLVVKLLLEEEKNRLGIGRVDWKIPMRPDHGNKMFEDIGKLSNPGYSLYGRMKGLAEFRGIEQALLLGL